MTYVYKEAYINIFYTTRRNYGMEITVCRYIAVYVSIKDFL